MLFVVEGKQGVHGGVYAQINARAAPAVAAVRSAFRDVLFAPERGASRAAVACFHINFRSVIKHGVSF